MLIAETALIVLFILTISLVLFYYFLPIQTLSLFQDHSGVVKSIPNQNSTIYLTIEQSPTNSTLEILDTLSQNKVQATFFVTYNPKDRDNFVKLVTEIHSRGHRIGIAPSRYNSANTHTTEENIHEGIKVVSKIIGSPVRLFRPIYSTYNKRIDHRYSFGDQKIDTITKDEDLERSLNNESERGRVVLGSVYPHDLHIPLTLINMWYLNAFTKTGSIIMLHDRPWTIPLLRVMIPNLIQKGFSFGMIPL